MQGQIFHCPSCHQLRAVQHGFILEQWHMYATPLKITDPAPAPGMQQLTNGGWVQFAPVVLCRDCVPDGATKTPLSEVGMRP